MIEITPDMPMATAGPRLYKIVVNKQNRQRPNFHALPLHMNIWFPVYEITTKLRSHTFWHNPAVKRLIFFP
ncbi:hypothetical protein [Sodalis glossinidius]|uniref:hypothetical protein n=1 Tax=Sodalis glossinidius TaxID=63612 RepID=UPI0011D0F8AB|nr:hypothetical protein [Sodalis glossinidius]